MAGAAFAATALATIALGGCTATPSAQDAAPSGATSPASSQAAPASQASPEGTETTCASKTGVLDRGPRAHAEGKVTVDESGNPIAYTVAAGDAWEAINYRFCSNFIQGMNSDWLYCGGRTHVIQPGDKLTLDPTEYPEPKCKRGS